MNIRGFHKTSLIDYPGKISTVIFTGGCNFRCGFCHNPGLVICDNRKGKVDSETVLNHLKKRKSVIEGVVISGGEPTLNGGLPGFCGSIRDLNFGLKIKIDTNGSRPDIISRLLDDRLIDYAALDIKTCPEKYREITGVKADTEKIISSLSILKESGIDYEIRTTCVPDFITEEDLRAIGEWTGRVKSYYLQQFTAQPGLLNPAYEKKQPYTKAYLESLLNIIRDFADNSAIRGI